MSKHFVIEGDKFGRWTVIQALGSILDNGVYKTAVMVKCECGKERRHFVSVLKNRLSTSCGCFRKENASLIIKGRTHKHGLSKHPLYQIWRGMKCRCYNENDKAYKDYGGRGVFVCDEWIDDFKCFYSWAISNGWAEGLLNDRKDNDREYSPSNCRFVTDAVSLRNRRNNVNVTFNSETKCITDWAIQIGVSCTSLKKRINKWGIQRALTTPKITV